VTAESLHALPDAVKQAIEDESLRIVDKIRRSSIAFVLIGGWAARAIVGPEHDRYTFDVDGVVASKSRFSELENLLKDEGLKASPSAWGCIFVKRLELPERLLERLNKNQTAFVSEKCQIKLEFSTPRIYTLDGKYFFEFPMDGYQEKRIPSRGGRASRANVALPEYIVASKLGTSDWKNIYDVGVLCRFAKIQDVVSIIRACDSWSELVLRKIVRFRQEAEGKMNGTAYTLLKAKNLDRGYAEYLKNLQSQLTNASQR
jgi:hypothetical protein